MSIIIRKGVALKVNRIVAARASTTMFTRKPCIEVAYLHFELEPFFIFPALSFANSAPDVITVRIKYEDEKARDIDLARFKEISKNNILE